MRKKKVMERLLDLQDRHRTLDQNYLDVLRRWNECKEHRIEAERELREANRTIIHLRRNMMPEEKVLTVYHITVSWSEGVDSHGFYTSWDDVEEELAEIRKSNDIPEDENESEDGRVFVGVFNQEIKIPPAVGK